MQGVSWHDGGNPSAIYKCIYLIRLLIHITHFSLKALQTTRRKFFLSNQGNIYQSDSFNCLEKNALGTSFLSSHQSLAITLHPPCGWWADMWTSLCPKHWNDSLKCDWQSGEHGQNLISDKEAGNHWVFSCLVSVVKGISVSLSFSNPFLKT